MASSSRSFLGRVLRQMDRSFWCLHDHLGSMALLGIPTLLGILLLAGGLILTLRTWNLDPFLQFALWAFVVPVTSLTALTLLPLPCAVFAWFQAEGKPKSPGESFRWGLTQLPKLLPVTFWLILSYCGWFLFLGLPMLVLWGRTSLAPFVALFEEGGRVFERSRRLMREDMAIHALATLFLSLIVILGLVIFLPRLILFSDLFSWPWLKQIEQSLWAFELVLGSVLVSGAAISWCVTLCLFYHDLRYHREGEWLRQKLEDLRSREFLQGERT